jgi:hypothetical protein
MKDGIITGGHRDESGITKHALPHSYLIRHNAPSHNAQKKGNYVGTLPPGRYPQNLWIDLRTTAGRLRDEAGQFSPQFEKFLFIK